MLQLYNLGLSFLNAIDELGEFLLFKPFSSYDIIENYSFFLSAQQKFRIRADLAQFENVTIASMVLGSAIVALLIFRLIKFVVGIITGS